MPTPIDSAISSVQAMGSAFTQSSCAPKEPFIKLPNSGNPPVLDYNIPQETCFSSQGSILKYIPPEYFQEFTKNIPENNYYDTVDKMTVAQAIAFFHPNVAASSIGTGHYASTVSASGMSVAAANTGVAGGLANNYASANVNSAAANSFVAANNYAVANAAMAAGNYASASAAPRANFSPDSAVTAGGLQDSIVTPTAWAPGVPGVPYVPPGAASMPYNNGSAHVDAAMRGDMPLAGNLVGNRLPGLTVIARPPRPVPRISIIEEYRTCSYLGNYGAGRVVRTFSLLPGERTTISVRTYSDSVTTRDYSTNCLDSFSNSSASELDHLVQQEQGSLSSSTDTGSGSGSSFLDFYSSKNSHTAMDFKFSTDINLLVFKAHMGGGYGRTSDELETLSHGFSNQYDYSHSAMRSSNMRSLQNSLSKHVQQSNSNRMVQVNTTTSSSVSSGEETSTVRELVNYNKSRVLNFVFRQMLQEYTTITSLINLKFAYSNGYPDTLRIVDLDNLVNMLTDIIKPGINAVTGNTYLDDTLCILLKHYCEVLNWEEDPKEFIEKKTLNIGGCLGLQDCIGTESFYRIKKGLVDTYTNGALVVNVHGVILNVHQQTLHTDSVVVDALMGQGEALDCFNQKAQDVETTRGHIANLQAMQDLQDSVQNGTNNQSFATQQIAMGAQQIALTTKQIEALDQQIDIINGLPVPADKVNLYKKVFSDCCDVPQTGCGCPPATP